MIHDTFVFFILSYSQPLNLCKGDKAGGSGRERKREIRAGRNVMARDMDAALSPREAKRLADAVERARRADHDRIKRQLRVLLDVDKERWTPEQVNLVSANQSVYDVLVRGRDRRMRDKARRAEIEDAPDVVSGAVARISAMMKEASHTVVYTGAGISTAAGIPDYRGPNGAWTLLERGGGGGKDIEIPHVVMTGKKPTRGHLALTSLLKEGHVKHIVSQNCDGLHARSGVAQHQLSELHGNWCVLSRLGFLSIFLFIFLIAESYTECTNNAWPPFAACYGRRIVVILFSSGCRRDQLRNKITNTQTFLT